jgi:hypothetical protein
MDSGIFVAAFAALTIFYAAAWIALCPSTSPKKKYTA